MQLSSSSAFAAAGIQLVGCRPVAADKQLVGYTPFAVGAEDS